MTWDDEYAAMIGMDNSYDTPRTESMPMIDVVAQRQDIDTSGSNDAWTGFFQKAIGSVLDYGIKRNAAKTGLQMQLAQQRQAQMMPAYMSQPVGLGGGLTMMHMLLIGGVVVVVMLGGKK